MYLADLKKSLSGAAKVPFTETREKKVFCAFCQTAAAKVE